jgi:transglutaminase-like putative cysteine protease
VKVAEQLPRHALIWIVLMQFALVAPHIERIPVWILVAYVFAAFWRMQVYSGRWSFPGRLIKAILILTSFSGIYFSFGSLIGLEPTVALLLTAFALKTFELATRKDAYVIIFLAYFVCITEFLFTQDILIVLYSVFNVVLITTALISLHQPVTARINFRPMRMAAVMLAQALPLMLVLFFLFPRIGPLWSVPLKSQSAKTGVSDFMRPGDISNLSQSTEVAFRVEFSGDIPAQSQLYWRGLVYSRLNQSTWTSLKYYDVPATERKPEPPAEIGVPVRYSILMQPTQQSWLYGLRYAVAQEAKVMGSPDFRLFSPVELEDQYRYSVQSWPQGVLDPQISAWRREVELALPEGMNPQARALAVNMRAESGSDEAFANAVMERFTQENFVYTLQPPLLGKHTVDDFLFGTRRGFCEHYANAFVVLMRAGGVPARVVAGYQGGEVNPVNGTVIVHQFDAHAWAEIWLGQRGWVRFDPTWAVSPDRIELGLEQAMAGEGSFLANSPLSPLRYRGIPWLNSMRLAYDALTWQWQSLVVSYDGEQQYQLLGQIFGEFTVRKFALVLLGSWALVLIPVAMSLLLGRKSGVSSAEDKLYAAFCDRMVRYGLARMPAESPAKFAARVAEALPAQADEVNGIAERYQSLVYDDRDLDDSARTELLQQLRQRVRSFRIRPVAGIKNPA